MGFYVRGLGSRVFVVEEEAAVRHAHTLGTWREGLERVAPLVGVQEGSETTSGAAGHDL